MADLSPEIIRLLIEESHLRAAKKIIGTAMQDAGARLDALRARRTPMDKLLGALHKPRPLGEQIAAETAELADLARGVEKIERLERASTERLQDELDRFVRDTSEEYRRGLAAVSNLADWEYALTRFEQKLAAYLRSLGEARNMVVAGYDRANKRLSQAGQDALQLAIAAGQVLEAETHFANHIADLHKEQVRNTPCQQACIPSIPSADYAYWTRRLPEMDIGSMQQEFNRILEMCEQLARDGIGILRSSLLHTRAEQSRLAKDYIGSYLASLRDYADQNWHDPAATEEIIRRIEGPDSGLGAAAPARPEPANPA